MVYLICSSPTLRPAVLVLLSLIIVLNWAFSTSSIQLRPSLEINNLGGVCHCWLILPYDDIILEVYQDVYYGCTYVMTDFLNNIEIMTSLQFTI